MWHIVVVLWIKAGIISYALPHEYNMEENCQEAIEEMAHHWKVKRGRWGMGCQRRIDA